MATRQSIEFDFSRAKGQVRRLQEIADRLSKLSDNAFENNINAVSTAWRGENSTKYINKGREIEDSIKNSVNQVRKTADTLQTIANNIYESEIKSLETAEIRTYH